MGLGKSVLQNTSKRLFLYFESWCENNYNTLNVTGKTLKMSRANM